MEELLDRPACARTDGRTRERTNVKKGSTNPWTNERTNGRTCARETVHRCPGRIGGFNRLQCTAAAMQLERPKNGG